MKLSEAIRLGSMLGPQMTNGSTFGPDQASCAHGAALLAVGVVGGSYCAALDVWPALLASEVLNPATQERFQLFSVIRELNDCHHWTREQIAGWVETIERAEEAKAQPVTEAVTVAS